MFARKLKPNEAYLSRRNMAVAFEGEFDFEKELEKSKTEEADPRADHWGAFVDGEATPVASLVMNRYDVRFDGHVVKMGGVGGVATLPPYRRGGAIRACMEASFRGLYDEGFTLSALYPFSTGYYAQFGFAHGATAFRWNVKLEDLARLPKTGGTVRQLFPGDDAADLLAVYNDVYKDVNLSVLREVYDRALIKENFQNMKRSVFVWYDGAGRPGAFLVGSREKETLNCWADFPRRNGLLFRDGEALCGLLNFVHTSFQANFDSIEFVVPGHIDLTGLLPELSDMNCHAFLNGMLRVVNVEKALKLCRCRGEGSLSVEVSDPLLPENRGVFRLSFAPGGENRVERVEEAPDVKLSIGALSQLLCGPKGAEDIPWTTGAQAENPAAPLANVFYRKPCHILDLF